MIGKGLFQSVATLLLLVGGTASQTLWAQTPATDWTAVSTTAMSITGDITFAPNDLQMAGFHYPLTQAAAATPQQLSGIGQFINVAKPASATLYRLKTPRAAKLLHGNTLCGGQDANWLLAVTGSNPPIDNGVVLALAFFSGDAQPPLDPSALNNSTALCGTFGYGR